MRLDIVDDTTELVERLSGLRIEVDVAREIELGNLIATLDYNGVRLCLAYKT